MNRHYKYLLPLAMFYMTIKVTTVLMIYKIITIGGLSVSASTLIIPLWFFVGDIIAEVYGYKVARDLIWIAIICQFAFAFICGSFAHIVSPDMMSNQKAYEEILSKLPRVALASFLAIALGGLLNAYAINKWKILLKGKFFGLRSLGASSIGELVFTICAYLIEFTGMTPINNILHLMAISYLFKLVINPMLVIPIAIIAKIIKQHEGINLYDGMVEKHPISDYLQGDSTVFKITEMYATEDNSSHFRDIVLQTPVKHILGNYSNKISVSDLMFRDSQPDSQFDWHTAPRKQYIIYLSGEVEVTVSDGERRVFRQGDVLLANDLFGHGHITKILTYGKSIIIAIDDKTSTIVNLN